MTNPPEDFPLTAASGFMDGELRDAVLGRPLPPLEAESETARRVRWSTMATEAYTALYALYEELRESGHAYAWSSAYEASGAAGTLLSEVRELVGERTIPPTQEPPASPCHTTQHCAALGWCYRCEPATREAVTHVIRAVTAMGVGPSRAGAVYDAVMEVLRGKPNAPRQPVLDIPAGEDPCPGK